MKTSLLALIALFLINAETFAQTQYDYATITYCGFHRHLEDSRTNAPHTRYKYKRKEVENGWDTSFALAHVKKMNSEGWELFNTETSGDGMLMYIFYLRKKIE